MMERSYDFIEQQTYSDIQTGSSVCRSLAQGAERANLSDHEQVAKERCSAHREIE